MNTAQDIQRALAAHATVQRAEINARYFKTGKGQYGEGDVFIGVSVPDCRKVAKKAAGVRRSVLRTLIISPIHEHRLTALLILVEEYARATKEKDARACERIVAWYTKYIARVNNWDLVDTSAWQILGEHVRVYGGEDVLYTYAKSVSLWKRRIGIVATFAYIRSGVYTHTVALAELLRDDTHDLIHKAVGWMLREVGKRNEQVLDQFLLQHAPHMPRTMLRYAIEKYSREKRSAWLRGHLQLVHERVYTRK
jgi:3-methyladenine DNA glycosylase AlkD